MATDLVIFNKRSCKHSTSRDDEVELFLAAATYTKNTAFSFHPSHFALPKDIAYMHILLRNQHSSEAWDNLYIILQRDFIVPAKIVAHWTIREILCSLRVSSVPKFIMFGELGQEKSVLVQCTI